MGVGNGFTARGLVRGLLLGPGLALCLGGCAGSPHQFSAGLSLAGHRRLALLPLENLSSRADAGDVLSRILFVELTRRNVFEVVESGEVDAALEALNIRNAGSLARAEIKAMGDTLKVDYLMLGSVLESGSVRTADGDIPSVGLALRLLNVSDARVVWTSMHFRTGDDRETLFGWGREQDAQRLAADLVEEMVKSLSKATTVSGGAAGSGGS